MSFKSGNELFNFALSKCSRMNYSYDDKKNVLKIKGPFVINEKILQSLSIYESMFGHRIDTLKIEYTENLDWIKDIDVRCLIISNLRLHEIPELPETLEELDFSHNQIRRLPKLPKLKKLNCSHNGIKELELHDGLEFLDCRFNRIKSLKLPSNMKYVDCSENNIVSHPDFRNCDKCTFYKNPFWYRERKGK